MGNNQGKPVDMDGEVSLSHFKLLRVVGRGAFGKVRIVERKDTGLSFALKYIRKDEVVRSESVRNIIRERRMLEHVNHPFICNLRYSFQDIEYMYLVVDLMSGGDLRFHISRKTFTEDAVRFWIAELGCALRYVHGQGIIHRDVKPDNVLLDAQGHVHLTDFNVASDIVPGKILSSKSGTLAYLAPEVYAGHGYDVRADWWSLGVTFYECIYNKAANPKYPVTNPAVSLLCLYAIKDALEVNPSRRLGATWESFIKHDFFCEIDFEALERKEIEPVFIPASDKTNFDATYDLEELLLEEAPLEARARRQKPRERLKDDATQKEIREDEMYRMMENEFRPFDYTVAAYKKMTEGHADLQINGLRPDPLVQTNGVGDVGRPLALTTDEAWPAPAPIGPDGLPIQGAHHATGHPDAAGVDPRGHSSGSNKSRPNSSHQRRQHPNHPPPPLPPYPRAYTNSHSGSHRAAGAPRANGPGVVMPSPTGGMQVTLDGSGSWSDLARQDATLPADASGANNEALMPEQPGGVFGFLNRKKGRTNSPKPKERGVLGKEGARVVIH